MVAIWTSSPRNRSSVNRSSNDDFPVAESPIKSSLNVSILQVGKQKAIYLKRLILARPA